MDATQDNFWSTLFQDDEHTCLASSLRNTETEAVRGGTELDLPSLQYFAINAHVPGSTRAIKNVTSYRNFLVEFDTDKDGRNLSKREQKKAMHDSGLPWSTCTWSGSRSLHYIVSLEDPLDTYKEYAFVSGWLHCIITASDQSTIDPARFSRVPGGMNVDKTAAKGLPPAEQTLMAVNGRVQNERFLRWLYSHPASEPTAKEIKGYSKSGSLTKCAPAFRVSQKDAEAKCNEKWPLTAGQKQANLMAWAVYLVTNTDLERDDMVGSIAANDLGNNRKQVEYERVIDRSMANLE
jgi:hypothetical protein